MSNKVVENTTMLEELSSFAMAVELPVLLLPVMEPKFPCKIFITFVIVFLTRSCAISRLACHRYYFQINEIFQDL